MTPVRGDVRYNDAQISEIMGEVTWLSMTGPSFDSMLKAIALIDQGDQVVFNRAGRARPIEWALRFNR